MAKVIDRNSEQYIANRVSGVTLVLNIVLSVFKALAGIAGHSGAMISDAIHSASDVLSTVVVMIGITFSNKDEDDDHQYGHEKLESVCAIIVAVMLFITACGIGKSGLEMLIAHYNGEVIKTPTRVALIAACVSIGLKEWMYWYTLIPAKRINSQALMADAWHHRSDALSSIGSLIGIGGAMLGFEFLDPLVSVVICIIIMKVALDIGKESVDQIVDKVADDKDIETIKKAVLEIEGVKRIDDLKTRVHATKLYVDLEIAVDGDLSMRQAHDIAERVHDNVEAAVETVKHIMVHVNPYE